MLNRRQFLTGSGAILAASAVMPPWRPARAQADAPTVLRAEKRAIEVLGKPASVFGIRRPDGKPGLITDASMPFRVHLENGSGEPTLIHWHGLKPPYQQDGVPGVSGPLIPPGASADYDFPLTFGGTYWMHSHQGFQEQQLMAAPLIIRDVESLLADQQEVVILLHDFSFRSSDEIFAGLRKTTKTASDTGMKMGGMPGMTGDDMQGMSMQDMGHQGGQEAMTGHGDMGASSMEMDLNDVAYDAFLANDRTLADPEIVRVEPGGRVLFRIINGASASNFVIDLGELTGELVAVDGHPVQPVSGSTFPIAMAQRLDLRVQLPKGQAAFPVLATLEGERKRTGIVLATPQAQVGKFSDVAAKTIGPLNFKLEQSLRAATPLTSKAPDRVHRIDLTGSMKDYVWGLNGQTYDKAKPFMVAKGERVEFILTNKTMMSHPMHLHGHFFQVVAVNGERYPGAIRDTVLVPPMTSVVIAFDADNPGKWIFHCHNLYHMESGMIGLVQYQGI